MKFLNHDYDCIYGSRFCKGGKMLNSNFTRYLFSKGGTLLSKNFLKLTSAIQQVVIKFLKKNS